MRQVQPGQNSAVDYTESICRRRGERKRGEKGGGREETWKEVSVDIEQEQASIYKLTNSSQACDCIV